MTDIHEALAEIKATVVAKPRVGRDAVNQPMVNSWVEAIGDTNPIYRDEDAARAVGHPGIVAPPAMIQVWTMFGLAGERPTDDPMGPIMKLMDDNGYIGVVATNCEQTYHRYLQPGEEVSISSEMGDVVGPKQTGLGEGWFINQHIVWRVGDEARRRNELADTQIQAQRIAGRDQRGARGPGRQLHDAALGIQGHQVLLGWRQGA